MMYMRTGEKSTKSKRLAKAKSLKGFHFFKKRRKQRNLTQKYFYTILFL